MADVSIICCSKGNTVQNNYIAYCLFNCEYFPWKLCFKVPLSSVVLTNHWRLWTNCGSLILTVTSFSLAADHVNWRCLQLHRVSGKIWSPTCMSLSSNWKATKNKQFLVNSILSLSRQQQCTLFRKTKSSLFQNE